MRVEGVAGELAPVRQNVVPAGDLRRDAEGAAGLHDHALLLAKVIVLRAQREGEVEIAHVVVDRAAAGETAGQCPAVALQLGRAAFLPRVLVAADDDRVLVLPEIEDAGVLPHRIGQILLKGKVAVGIGAGADVIL